MKTESEGFALPAAVFALVLVGVMVTSGFFLARQESRIGAASARAPMALNMAEQAIEEVRLAWRPPAYNAMPMWSDTVHTGSTPEGDWRVTVTRTDTMSFFLSATAEVTEGGQVLSGASRTIGMLARVRPPTIDPPAALTTRGPTNVRGNSSVNGTDEAPAGWDCPPTQDKTGILAQDTSEVQEQGNANITGDPPKDEDPDLGDDDFTVFGEITYDQMAGMADIEFGTATVNPSPTLDGNGDCDYSDDENWGDPENPDQPCGDYFPTIHFSGNASVQSDGQGQGILLVDGDLSIQGSFSFYGIVIVGGTITTRGSGVNAPRIVGGVYASNATIEDQGGAGSSELYTSTCAVKKAVENNWSAARPLQLRDRGWVDVSGTSG